MAPSTIFWERRWMSTTRVLLLKTEENISTGKLL
jgi:hypothetical protein